MTRFILKYDLEIFGKTDHIAFCFSDYDEALKTYINMCRDKSFKNLCIIKEVYKLVSCEVVK